jgi:hypothetical protein
MYAPGDFWVVQPIKKHSSVPNEEMGYVGDDESIR